jgi:spoIIIJ-associated protein
VEWVETTGRTVAEALEAALDQLGVDKDETEYHVVDEPQKGLFGRLRVEARVRARVRPVRPRPKAERRDRRRRGDRPARGRNGGSGSGRSRPGGSRQQAGRGSGNGAGKSSDAPERAVEGRNGVSSAAGTERAERAGEAGQSSDRARRRRRGGRGRQGGEAKEQGAIVANESSEVTETARPVLDLDEQRAAVESFLKGLVEAFGRADATVSVVPVDEITLEADVRGEELGLLVGPKGQTLQAVHELVRSMVQRRFVGQSHARIRVDVAGYRERRREALERFTRTVVDEVLSSGEAKRLDPMGASDRKVVHDVVNELDGVVTVSQGEEPARRVIIRPA